MGSSYLYWKHEKADRWLGTGEKVSLVTEVLIDAGYQEIVDFFNETHYKEIRNCFFHCSYALGENIFHLIDSAPIYINRRGLSSFNIMDFIIPQVDKCLEFFHAFKDCNLHHFSSYTTIKKITGKFPISMEIEVLGSSKGLAGFIAGGAYIKLENDFWSAMSIRFDSVSETDRFISDELNRFIAKDRIRTDDGSLRYLNEIINERNIKEEKENLAIVYQRFGDIKKSEAMAEENPFKKRDLSYRALYFYNKMLGLDIKKYITNNIACLKYYLSENPDSDKEAFNDFLDCIRREPDSNPITNALHILKELRSKGINIEIEKKQFEALLKKNKSKGIEELIKEVLADISKW